MMSKAILLQQAQSYLAPSIKNAWEVSVKTSSGERSPDKIKALHVGLDTYMQYYINYISGNKNLYNYTVWFQLETNTQKTYRLPEAHGKFFNVDGAMIKTTEKDKNKTEVVFLTKMPLTSLDKNKENILNTPNSEYARRIYPAHPNILTVQINFIPNSSYRWNGDKAIYQLEPKIKFHRTRQIDENGCSYALGLPEQGKNFREINILYDIPTFSAPLLTRADYKNCILDPVFNPIITSIHGLSRTLKALELL